MNAPAINTAPAGFDADRDLAPGFMAFYRPLHDAFARRQQDLALRRIEALAAAHGGQLPDYLASSPATREPWRIELPAWCADQRNQMTGPADDAELVVKMLNSGAPGVMLDLEDSMANQWPNLLIGYRNILDALIGKLAYDDVKRARRVGIETSSTVTWTRVRGLHLSQGGVMSDGAITSASLFDLAAIIYRVAAERLKHPLCIYIPKSESADEGLWWRDVFQALARARGWPEDTIKCMALVESHPLAYQMEEFLYALRDHILGLNLGRWDYMASLIHFNLEDPRWVLPDRNMIPHDVPFFQRLRHRMVDICHRHGALAIGGMTALYPSRDNPELNERALKVLEQDKRNEANCLMDGAWTGHPDQNAIAVAQFPAPNQIARRPRPEELNDDLRPAPPATLPRTVAGTRAAARTSIRYRGGVLRGKGAVLLDGYMEDLATDRIYRLMIAQRMRHSTQVQVLDDNGNPVPHTQVFVSSCFDAELERLLADAKLPPDERREGVLREARELSEAMIRHGWFNPI
jgi:malate synthase